VLCQDMLDALDTPRPPRCSPYLKLKGGDHFAFAGLYEAARMLRAKTSRALRSSQLRPNSLVAAVHDRIPAILSPEEEQDWLRPDTTEPAERLLMLGS
jgi:putative SOS response-associated peptidase YedK